MIGRVDSARKSSQEKKKAYEVLPATAIYYWHPKNE
jgi:hypothetical protein